MKQHRTRGGALGRGLMWLAMLALAAAAAWGWHDFNRFARAPLHVATTGGSIDVARGSSFKTIVADLRQQGVTHAHPLYWRALAEQMRVAGKLHAGEYALRPGITPRTLLANMAAGRVLQRNLTIVDGWTFQELRQALARAEKLKHDSSGLDDAAVMQRIGAAGENPEGRFLPETYAYVKGDSDLDILRRAHQAMVKTLASLWAARAPDLPLATPYDALILASIVEKETGKPDERAQIAGVFVRRLRNHMLLQTDPTVIYGMGARYAGNIRRSDLTTDTPYNTYTRPGLPPTPIALPGKAALQATLHPAAGDTLYFVARGDGGHVFSSTLAEHNRNVDCYQRKRCP
ncbi:MAG TPA: endolytic transglycosylase MltG [Rhodanobacter sp.]|nr:endolytic transglycosylase MltG [Rhodanobacter sp.]